MIWAYCTACILAFLATYIATPLVKRIALSFGAIDRPDQRKIHARPIPRWGGLALFAGIITGTTLAYLAFPALRSLPHELHPSEIRGIVGACTLMLILGMIDDVTPLPAKVKLVVQIVATVWCLAEGVRVSYITNPFTHHIVYLEPILSIVITGLWIVGITNALNLLDGLDGLLTGISTIAAIALSAVAIEKGYVLSALTLFAMCGASLAFLRYNFNPAQIFLGDTGSYFLGMLWATMSIAGALKTPTVAVFIPLLILGLPIADTLFAIIRRFGNRQPIFQPDKEHFHHRLLKLGWSQKQAVIALYLVSGLLGTLALLVNRLLK